MRLNLGFLRRRSEASLSTRPQPEEAQKWTESFTVLMASKCKIYSLNSCIFHSCMRIIKCQTKIHTYEGNENLN